MYTYNTGINSKGWGLLVSGSSRWSDEGYVPGTYYSSGSYLMSIEKKWSQLCDIFMLWIHVTFFVFFSVNRKIRSLNSSQPQLR